MTPWPVEVTDFTSRQWAAGLSAAEICDKLSDKFSLKISRSAVVGKIRRLGLLNRERKIGGVIFMRRQFMDAPKPDIEVPESQRKTFMQLKKHHCRWPYGDPGTEGFYFCGGISVEGKPYCESHLERSVVRRECQG